MYVVSLPETIRQKSTFWSDRTEFGQSDVSSLETSNLVLSFEVVKNIYFRVFLTELSTLATLISIINIACGSLLNLSIF